MKAKPGDWLFVEAPTLADRRREGLVTRVLGADGAPPYRVRWLDTGLQTLVYPDAGSRVETQQEHREATRKAVRYAAHPEAEAVR